MLVVADIDEVFVPVRSGLFVKPAERQNAIESLLNVLPERFGQMAYPETALGSALRVSLAALVNILYADLVYKFTFPHRLGVVATL